jgi:hypothetical protein
LRWASRFIKLAFAQMTFENEFLMHFFFVGIDFYKVLHNTVRLLRERFNIRSQFRFIVRTITLFLLIARDFTHTARVRIITYII